MIYPNGTLSINILKKYIESDEYTVYAEEISEEPKDWDFFKQGYYRGNLIELRNFEDLKLYAFNERYRICYEHTDKFYTHNAYYGEEIYSKDFRWEYNNGIDRHYVIQKAKNTLELIKYDSGENSVFTLGYWDKGNDFFEFRSVGNRFFQYINTDDIEIIYKAMKKADSYLNGEEN